jgi:hypothetical protein
MRCDQRGVGHRRERWGGLRWTRQRRVCKGSQGGFPVSDDRHADERCCSRTAKTCGPDASTPASSLAEGKSARPGADEPGFREMTVTRKPITGERGISRKPLRAGMSGDFRWLAVNTRVHTCYPMRTRGCGCIGRPAFPTPSELRGRNVDANLARNPRRDRETVFADTVFADDGCCLSCPDLIRASIHLRKKVLEEDGLPDQARQ